MFRIAMLAAALSAFCLCAWPNRAAAQTDLTLRADPVPIVRVQINGAPVNLEVDTQSADGVVMMNSAFARRLGLTPAMFGRMRVGVDGSDAMLVGRIARPSITLADGNEVRAVVGIFGVPVSSRADGVIGIDTLPYETVTIILAEAASAERSVVLPTLAPGSWRTRSQIGGRDYIIGFHLQRGATVINRRASDVLDGAGQLQANGGLVEATAILGLTTAMQPVRTDLRVEGLTLGTTLARVNSPLLGAIEEDAIVVTAAGPALSQPAIFLGREALSRCSSMTSSRSAQTLTLRCAN
jgi:hypothetical protein